MRGTSYPMDILLAFYEIAKTTPKPSLKMREDLVFQFYGLTRPTPDAPKDERSNYDSVVKNIKIWFDNLAMRGIPGKLMKELRNRGEMIPENFLKIKKGKPEYRPYDMRPARSQSLVPLVQAGPPCTPRPQTAPVIFYNYSDQMIVPENDYQPMIDTVYPTPDYIPAAPIQEYDMGNFQQHTAPDTIHEQQHLLHQPSQQHQHQLEPTTDDEVVIRVVIENVNTPQHSTFTDLRIKKNQTLGNDVFEPCRPLLKEFVKMQVQMAPPIDQPMPVTIRAMEQYSAKDTMALARPMAQDLPILSNSAQVPSTPNKNFEIDFSLLDEFLVSNDHDVDHDDSVNNENFTEICSDHCDFYGYFA